MTAGRFGAVVTANRPRFSALLDDFVQHTCHAPAREAGINLQREDSRVKASTTLNTRIARPAAIASCRKSSARSWLAAVYSRKGALCLAQCFRFFRRNVSPASRYTRCTRLWFTNLRNGAAALAIADIRNEASLWPIPPDEPADHHLSLARDSGRSKPRPSTDRKLTAGGRRTVVRHARQLPSWLRAPSVFSNHRLQRFLVQARIRHELAKTRALIPKLLGFLCLAHIHPTILRLPGVDGVLRTLVSSGCAAGPCGKFHVPPAHKMIFLLMIPLRAIAMVASLAMRQSRYGLVHGIRHGASLILELVLQSTILA